MAIEHTLSIIKPDAINRNIIGSIINLIEKNGLQIIEAKMLQLSKEQAKAFYSIHNGEPYFDSLVEYITSGKIMVLKLEGDNAITRYREIMGSTDPEHAEEGTIRKIFAESMQKNSVHGSDSSESAETEIKFFFNK
tara:strand:+ start:227988 stop:228395 length:408 start_codon:yes stop_codon:yes gene_type:complete